MAMRIKWVGHATYEISSATGTTLVIDPWYTESPVATTGLPDKADFVLVTHDHWDHVKDVAPLARSGAKVVTQPEVVARSACLHFMKPIYGWQYENYWLKP